MHGLETIKALNEREAEKAAEAEMTEVYKALAGRKADLQSDAKYLRQLSEDLFTLTKSAGGSELSQNRTRLREIADRLEQLV